MYTVTFTDKDGNTVSYHAMSKNQAEQIASEYASQYKGCKVSITGSPELAQVEQAVSPDETEVETPPTKRIRPKSPQRKYTGPDKVLYINPKSIPNHPVGSSFGPADNIQSILNRNHEDYYVVLYNPTKTAWGKHVIAAKFKGNAKWYNPYMSAIIAARRMAGWTGWGWKEYLITPNNKVIQLKFTNKPVNNQNYIDSLNNLKKVLPPFTPKLLSTTNVSEPVSVPVYRPRTSMYKVVFIDENGSNVYNALTLQKAEEIAANLRKEYPGNHVYIVKPQGEIDRVIFNSVPNEPLRKTSPLEKSNETNTRETSLGLGLDRAIHRAAVDSENAQLVAAYAQKLIDEGKSPQEIEKALQERYGVQANIKTLTFKESPEAAMYRQIEKEERAREAAEEAQNTIDSTMASISPEYSLVSGLNKIGKSVGSIAKQLNEAAMKNSNPVIAYGEAVGAALLGAAAGVAELPEQTAEFVASAAKNPFKAVKSILFAPVTTVEEAAKDVESGNIVDYGKLVGQTLVAGEVADELGVTPSKVVEKVPFSERVLAPAREFADRATAKLNDVFVKPLTEYKPQRTTVIVDTGEEKPIVTISKSPEQATLAAIKDVGRVKEIKPVTGLVAETAFNLKAEPVEDIAEYQNPTKEGTVKVRGESVEGKAFTKARLKTGYELQTENPVRSVKVVTEYANRLGRKAVLASELGEDSVKLLLKKGDEIKGYGVKVVDTYPLWDQESLGNLRVFPEEDVKETIDLRNEETAKPIETIDLREMDENVRKAVLGDEEKNGVKNTEERVYGNGEQTYELKDETSQSRFKVVDISDELRTLENELNDEIELPDISKTFEKAIDFGKDVLDIGMGLGISGLNGMSKLERAHARNTISNILYNDVIGKQKGKDEASNKNRPDVSPDVTPATKPSTSVTPSTTPAVTPGVIPYSTPEPETNAKSKTKKPEPPELPFYIPPTGGEDFYRIIEGEGGRFGRAIKVNPVIDNPLTVLFGGGSKGKKKSRRKRR